MGYPDGVQPGKLVEVKVMSIYNNHTAVLPTRMRWMTPDTAQALASLAEDLQGIGGMIYLSDAYRSEFEQAKAHYDYLTGVGRYGDRSVLVMQYPDLKDYQGVPKKAYSPPPGNSVHEAGRAVDFDADPRWLGIDQHTFMELAYANGWVNIVGGIGGVGDPLRVDTPEEWHIEHRGPFQAVYAEVLRRTGDRGNAYKTMVHEMLKDLRTPNPES